MQFFKEAADNQAEEDSVVIGVLPDGRFTTQVNGIATPVGPAVQRELEAEYKRQQRFKDAVAQGQNPDDIKAQDDSRLSRPLQKDIGDENRLAADPERTPYYKQNMDEKTRRLFDREYFHSNDVQKLTDLLLYMLGSFADNQIYEAEFDDPKIRITKSYQVPNPRATLDPDSAAKGRRRVHYEPDEDDDEETREDERPMALLYLDRSGSFDTPQKIKLGNDLRDLITSQQFCDADGHPLLDADTWYFGDYVSKDENNVGGGTNLQAVLDDIAQKTNGRIANVIIVTDRDAEAYTRGDPVLINGSVWLIYAASYSPNFAKRFRLEGPESTFKTFYFSNIR